MGPPPSAEPSVVGALPGCEVDREKLAAANPQEINDGGPAGVQGWQTEATLREGRATHDEWIQGVALHQLAACAVAEGRLEDAVSLLKEGYRIHSGLGDGLFVAAFVCRFAAVLALAGRPETAACVLTTSGVLLEGIGARPPWITKMTDRTLASIRAQLDEATFAGASERGMLLTADEAVALALDALG
jgi:hypothetical protein